MKIELICIEKTKKIEYKNIIQDYSNRINKKLSIKIKEISFVNPGKLGKESISNKQVNLIQRHINEKDYVVIGVEEIYQKHYHIKI